MLAIQIPTVSGFFQTQKFTHSKISNLQVTMEKKSLVNYHYYTWHYKYSNHLITKRLNAGFI